MIAKEKMLPFQMHSFVSLLVVISVSPEFPLNMATSNIEFQWPVLFQGMITYAIIH